MTRKKAIKRKYGKGSRVCTRCGSSKGVIRKYRLFYCRRCFREVAQDLGFNKFR
ncbi:MAG: 30S ribosomal protein S14 [Candidatus Aenigmarchaeota archaeon]|nr:30S ribosomal protein S14 [Candidatus Aenigmarchaeota archaeon]